MTRRGASTEVVPGDGASSGWSITRRMFSRHVAGVETPVAVATSALSAVEPAAAVLDPVSAAVARGHATSTADTAPRSVLDEAERLSLGGPTGRGALLGLIARYPETLRLQVLAARLIEAEKDANEAPAVWMMIAERAPHSDEALRMTLRWAARLSDQEAARAILDRRFPARPEDDAGVLLYARACDELKLYDEADWAFQDARTRDPQRVEPVLAHVKSLEARGLLDRAIDLLDGLDPQMGLRDSVIRARTRINLDRHFLEAIQPENAVGTHAGNAVLAKLLDQIAARRKATVPGHRSFVGSILMINGSLGSGGAERQLTNTALGLQQAIDGGSKVYGRDMIGPVTVCVRSLTSRPGADFFQPTLQRAHVATMEYSGLDVYGGNRRQSLVREVQDMMRFLPPQMAEGTERLTDMIAGLRPDVVHIWQDGTILAAALAALLAGVPRIVLSVRTVPPIDRPSRMKPQYEILYPALLRMPGVVLSANSHFAARRYADWLGVDAATIPVVHNGLDRLPDDGDTESASLLSAFDAATPGFDFTVGSVMRFDDNKRPYVWLDCAAAVFAHCPTARFIMVGDGPLFIAAKQYAEMLGISSRVLFTGQTRRVGYWLKQFDAFLLLSKFEGLPNVLIEAQFAGVPVISTPAGGAAETVRQGETGFILPEGDTVDVACVADVLMTVRMNHHNRPAFVKAATEWAEGNFTVDQMLERTVRVYTQ